MKLLPSQIHIGQRQRIDLGDINDLANSIERLGQAQDILVEDLGDGQYNLIAGRRRVAACTQLGIEVGARCLDANQIEKMSKMNDAQRSLFIQELELEEDTKRKNRTWQELALAWLKLHEFKGYTDPEWSLRKLAEIVDRSVGHVSEALNIARALRNTQGQTDEWSVKLWSSESIFDACRHMMGRNEDLIYAEMAKRKQASLEAQKLAAPAPQGSIQSLNPTSEAAIAPVQRSIQWNNRLPEPDECKAILMSAPKGENIIPYLEYLAPTGCAVIIFDSILDWNISCVSAQNEGYDVVPFPIIWNTLMGTQTSGYPVQASYKPCLFLSRTGYKPPFQTPKQAVFTEFCNPAMDWLPAKAVLQLLDIISLEGDKIWLPLGGPVVDVYRAGRIPVWQNTNDEELKKEFTKQFGANIKFI